MRFKEEFDIDILNKEYNVWMSRWGNGRNDQNLRFGQHIAILYLAEGHHAPDLFYAELPKKAWEIACEILHARRQ